MIYELQVVYFTYFVSIYVSQIRYDFFFPPNKNLTRFGTSKVVKLRDFDRGLTIKTF